MAHANTDRALQAVRDALLTAAVEHRRHHALCLLEDFEEWETEQEYLGWLKAEEHLSELAEGLGLDVVGTLPDEAGSRLRAEYEGRLETAEDELREARLALTDLAPDAGDPYYEAKRRAWAAEEALQQGPAVLYYLDHAGSLDGYERP